MVRWIASLLCVFFVAANGLAEDQKVPLKIEIPTEVLAGTPPNVLAKLYPDLELPSKESLALMVPKGTKNLALKKKVIASEMDPILGELGFVTDGNKEGSEDAYVELSPGKQWVQIDLGTSSKIYAVAVWHYFRAARGYRDVIVQVSEDPKFEKNIHTIHNNDTDASAKMGIGRDRPYIETNLGKLIDAKGVTGRYVRLYSDGSTADDLNHYTEVEVFGKPAA